MTDKATRFTVLEGGRDKRAKINTVAVSVVAGAVMPLPVDVRVFEEDTHLVLTVDPVIRLTEEHPIQLMTGVMDAKPNEPGSIVTNNGSWYAVIHDLDQEPTWKRVWIEKAYREIFLLGEKKGVRKIALPLLGSVHGRFSPTESLKILAGSIHSMPLKQLKVVLVLVPQTDCRSIREHLQKLAGELTRQTPHPV